MRRLISVLAVSVLMLTAFVAFHVSGDSCQGGCYTPCDGCYLTATAEAGVAEESSLNARSAGVGAFTLQDATPGAAGTPDPEDKCHLGNIQLGTEVRQLLGYAVLFPDPERPLCLFEIQLPPGDLSTSRIFPGEATTYYVSEGQIEFANDDTKGGQGYVLVKPGALDSPPDLPSDRDGTFRAGAGAAPFTLNKGGSFFLDDLQGGARVDLIYQNKTEEPATLIIASAPKDEEPEPTVGPEGTPEP